MPNVNGQQFPYTPQGMQAAQQAQQAQQVQRRPAPLPSSSPVGPEMGMNMQPPRLPRKPPVVGGQGTTPRSSSLSQAPKFPGGSGAAGATGRRKPPQGEGSPGVARRGGNMQPVQVGNPMRFGGMGDVPMAMASAAIPGVGPQGTMNPKWQQSAHKWGGQST